SRHLRPRRRRRDGDGAGRAVHRADSDLPADSRGQRRRRAADDQRARVAGGTRVHAGGRTRGRAGLDRELHASNDSAHRGEVTDAEAAETRALGLGAGRRGDGVVRAGAADAEHAEERRDDAGVDHRSVSRDSGRPRARQRRQPPRERRQHRDGGDRARRAGDEDRHRGASACVRGRSRRCSPEVRRPQRSDRRLQGRPEAEGRRRREAGVLSGGAETLAAERRDDLESVLRQRDADLRVVHTVRLSYTKHTLANGLDVILHEDRACPIVAVNVWYHVGSKNERRGHTGFAHLFEHLMFEGSQHYDAGYFQPLQGAGATLNGSTNADRTNYWEVVPTNALDLALWMESDRMGFLLPALTMQKFENQRDVVLNERRQNYENRPYGLAPMALLAALFPPDHPYHWTTIGEVADLEATRLDDVQAFFARYYHPANASLAVAGDFDPGETLALVDRYFGSIDAGPRVDRVTASASLS